MGGGSAGFGFGVGFFGFFATSDLAYNVGTMAREPWKLPDDIVYAEIDPDTAKYAFEQAVRRHEFALESRDVLLSGAHSTLQWLFGLAAASFWVMDKAMAAAMAATQANTGRADIGRAVVGAVIGVLSALFALALLRALRPKTFHSAGNEPRNLIDVVKSDNAAMAYVGGLPNIAAAIEATTMENKRLAEVVLGTRKAFCWLVVGLGVGILLVRFL